MSQMRLKYRRQPWFYFNYNELISLSRNEEKK